MQEIGEANVWFGPRGINGTARRERPLSTCAVTRHNIRREMPYKTISYNIFVLFSSCRRVWLTMPVHLHSHTYRAFARIYSGTCRFRAIYAHGLLVIIFCATASGSLFIKQ